MSVYIKVKGYGIMVWDTKHSRRFTILGYVQKLLKTSIISYIQYLKHFHK